VNNPDTEPAVARSAHLPWRATSAGCADTRTFRRSGSSYEPQSIHTENIRFTRDQMLSLQTHARATATEAKPSIPGPALIDASLARGIRRAYLDTLDRAWLGWRQAHAACVARTPVFGMPNAKAFAKRCIHEERTLRRFLPVDELKLATGRKRLWACLSLVRERHESAAGRHRIASAGFGRVAARVVSFPGGAQLARFPVRFTGHVIDRVIQRTRVVKLPVQRTDIDAIHASFSGALLWSIAAIAVLDRLHDDPAQPLCIPLPVERGIFLAAPDAIGELVVKTYVQREDLWDEERYALSKFEHLGDTRASLFAAEVLCPALFGHGAPLEWAEAMLQAWKELHWLIRAKRDRPGSLATAWRSD
jgi:hypothetical protein